jgi:L-lactate dehydrogenase complex protein LldG
VANAAPEVPPADLSDRFEQELETLGGKAQRVTRAALPDTLLALLRERGIDSVLAWDQVEGLDQSRLVAAGLSLVRAADPTVRAGLTGAVAAIAQIGSLVLTAGQGRPLSASLLPEIHIAVVYRAHLIWSLEEALQLREVREASATVLITGPSRTADIEMTLTIGVHGPKELIVFIVD